MHVTARYKNMDWNRRNDNNNDDQVFDYFNALPSVFETMIESLIWRTNEQLAKRSTQFVYAIVMHSYYLCAPYMRMRVRQAGRCVGVCVCWGVRTGMFVYTYTYLYMGGRMD